MKAIIQKTIFLVLIFLCGALISNSTQAAEYHTTTVLEENHRTNPYSHFYYNAWIYTKYDTVSGHTQVYYQYLARTLTSPRKLEEIQLTTSAFDKSLPQWGRVDINMDYYATSSSTVDNTCNGGNLFYYLGNPDGSGNQMYLGCILKLDSSTHSTAFVDAPLTDFTTSGYDINTYAVATSHSTILQYGTTTYDSTSTNPEVNGPYIVFTTTDGKMHFLIHDKTVYGDTTGITNHYVITDPETTYTDSFGTSYDYQWGHFVKGIYSSPQFDDVNEGFIVFLKKAGATLTNQIGLTNIYAHDVRFGTGLYEDMLTIPATQEIRHPQFGDNSNSNIFFEYIEDSSHKGYIAEMVLQQPSTSTVTGWCDEIFTVSDSLYSRHALNTRYESGTKSTNFSVTYSRTQADGNNDIYNTVIPIANCTGGIPSTSPVTNVTPYISIYSEPTTPTPITSFSPTPENQLTCMDDNYFPMFLLNAYRDSSFSNARSSAYTNVIMLRNRLDGTGDFLIDIYDTDNPTNECRDTCFQNEDRSAIDDNNSYLDSDGIKDSCEVVPCTYEVLTASPGDDFDSDGIRNVTDNCPCSYNPTQYDPDGDGVGEVYQTGSENGCDNCPGTSNPADIDHNGDTNFSPLDTDWRQIDTDNDGDGDACDAEPVVPEPEDPCGDTDTDYDGAHDSCDNCMALANFAQTDTDADGVGDTCDICPNLADAEQVDSDGDGVGDTCDNCANMENTDQADADGDGVGDTCESSPAIVVAPTSGSYGVYGGFASCSLNTSRSEDNIATGFAWLIIALPMLLLRKKQSV